MFSAIRLDFLLVNHWYTRMETESITLSAQAYSKIRGLILDGTLAPGDVLSERNIAKELAFSRMPVREAIRELAKDGLLDVSPGRGAFVRRLSVSEVRDTYEARQAIEGMTAYLAAKRGITTELLAIRAVFQNFLDNPDDADLTAVQKAGDDLHHAIADAARNPELARILDSLQAQIALTLRMAVDHNPGRIPVSMKEHIGILDAIEKGDANMARQLMENHLAHGFESRLQLYNQSL